MSIFSRRRPHLRAVDLQEIPATGPPVIANHRTPGEMIGAMVDQLRELDNAVVLLQTQIEQNRDQRTEIAAKIVEHVRGLGIGPEVVERIQSRRDQ